MFVLRPYQIVDVEQLRAAHREGHKRVCYCLPTGGGKTIIFVEIVRRARKRGTRIAILVHRIELVDQTARALTETGIVFGVVAAGYPETPGADVLLCMVQTLSRRHGRLDDVKLIVVDECHHVVAKSYLAILAQAPEAYMLGVSATPERLDGKGLDDSFETLIVGASVRELIDLGFLARFKLFAPEKRPDLSAVRTRAGDYEVEDLTKVMTTAEILLPAVNEYQKHCDGERILAFCASVAASRLTVDCLRRASYRAAHLDGGSPKDERRDVLAKLATGEIQIVSNCSLFGEGVDIPTVRIVNPGVDHGFNSEDRRAYNPDVAKLAMERTLNALSCGLQVDRG
jgi:DNA repair protein RadD